MNYEKDLSTEQDPTQAEIGIPRPNENGLRTKNHPPSPQHRTKSPLRLSTLKKRKEFLQLSRKGRHLVGEFLAIEWRKGPSFRFGITASSRFGSSPERSRFKRLAREAVRSSLQELPNDLEINILPRKKAKTAKMGDIRSELLRLLLC